jgi:hypothetical protein
MILAQIPGIPISHFTPKQENVKTSPSSVGALSPIFLYKIQSHTASLSSGDYSPLVNGYALRGLILTRLQVGESIVVLRTHRNGEEIPGVFRSSTIAEIENDMIFWTMNSTWLLLPLNIPLYGDDLLFSGVRGGRPIQCRLCGSIIRCLESHPTPACRCGLSSAPAIGTSIENNPSWTEGNIAKFLDPKAFNANETEHRKERRNG